MRHPPVAHPMKRRLVDPVTTALRIRAPAPFRFARLLTLCYGEVPKAISLQKSPINPINWIRLRSWGSGVRISSGTPRPNRTSCGQVYRPDRGGQGSRYAFAAYTHHRLDHESMDFRVPATAARLETLRSVQLSRAASASASFWVPSEASVGPSTPHVSSSRP